MKLLAKFDFGNEGTYADEGYIKVERLFNDPCYMWVNELRNKWFAGEKRSPFRDVVYQKRGEFRLGLTKGRVRIMLFFSDPSEEHAPFPVYFSKVEAHKPILCAEKTYALVNVTSDTEKVTKTEAEFDFDGGVLAISFPSPFFISGLELYGDGCELARIYDEAPVWELPSMAEFEKAEPLSKEDMLKRICDYFLESRTPDGFVGDFEFNKKLWYTTSYPIRTWLCGYELFGEKKYLDACENILDKFISEQMPEGSFTQVFRNQKTVDLTEEQLQNIRENNWMNLADVGSMVAALTASCKYVGAERKEKYLAAAKRYIDDWAMRYRQDCGGFTNGWVCRPAEKIYSVSTASTALTCAFLFELTGEKRYLDVAESAVLFMAKDWNDDGRMIHYVYDRMYPGHDFYQNAGEFADGFYTAETLSAVLAISKNDEVRRTVFGALKKYLFGSVGLFELKKGLPWWKLQNIWHNSKSAGNPIFMLDFIRLGKEFGASENELARAEKELAICEKFLCVPEYSYRLGVLMKAPDGEYPFSNHAIQCWSGCSVAATGFCGIAVADMLKENIIYLK